MMQEFYPGASDLNVFKLVNFTKPKIKMYKSNFQQK